MPGRFGLRNGHFVDIQGCRLPIKIKFVAQLIKLFTGSRVIFLKLKIFEPIRVDFSPTPLFPSPFHTKRVWIFKFSLPPPPSTVAPFTQFRVSTTSYHAPHLHIMPSAELAVGIANLPNQRCFSPLPLLRYRCLRGNLTNFHLGIKLSPNGGQPSLLCLQVTFTLESFSLTCM